MIRETFARFGRENLGFLWIVAEPLVFALPVIGMWSLIRARYEHGIPMVGMVWTGYLPTLLFRHMVSRSLLFARRGSGLLYHRNVKIFDLFISQALLETLSNLAALLISGVLLYVLGALEPPRDWMLFYVGYFYMIWWSLAMALVVGGLSERNEIIEKFWMPFSYMYMPISGFFYIAEWLPDTVRNWALLVVPSLHAYEMMRNGLFGNTFNAYYWPSYLTFVLAIITVIGLKLVRDTREFLVME